MHTDNINNGVITGFSMMFRAAVSKWYDTCDIKLKRRFGPVYKFGMKDDNQKRIQSFYGLPQAMEMRSHVITTSQRLDNIVFILRFGATTDRIDRQSFFDTSRIVAMQQLDWERPRNAENARYVSALKRKTAGFLNYIV